MTESLKGKGKHKRRQRNRKRGEEKLSNETENKGFMTIPQGPVSEIYN
jgi:hypothetical protein